MCSKKRNIKEIGTGKQEGLMGRVKEVRGRKKMKEKRAKGRERRKGKRGGSKGRDGGKVTERNREIKNEVEREIGKGKGRKGERLF